MDDDELDELFNDSLKPDNRPKKNTQKRRGKRPPRKVSMNLDALLMDGIEDTQQEASIEAVVSPNKSPVKVNNTYSIENMENRLNRYVDKQLQSISEEFSEELQRIIEDNDIFEWKVPIFLDELKQILKDSILLKPEVENKIAMSNLFDQLSGFQDPFRESEQLTSYTCTDETKSIRVCNGLIASRKPIYMKQYAISGSDLKSEISKLNNSRIQLKTLKSEARHKRKALIREMNECESKKLKQEQDSEMIIRKLARLDQDRQALMIFDEQTPISDETVAVTIKKMISQIKSEIKAVLSYPLRKLHTTQKNISEASQELNELHNMYIFQFSLFSKKLNFMINDDDNYPNTPQTESIAKSVSWVPMKYRMMQQDAENQLSQRKQNLNGIGRARQKLAEIQQKRDTDLENMSSFLHQISQTENENDFNSRSYLQTPRMKP